jgi:SAM-dependent methyltransferase
VTRKLATDFDVLDRLVQPAGKDVVDIGCGGGALVRQLAGLGARAVGVEISEQQLAAAVEQDGRAGARYLVGRAQQLPLADGAVDVAVFMRTLHHVPPRHMRQALREAARVLRPRGVVYVAEPLAEGDYFQLTSLVDNEFDVREAAQRALQDAALAGLERVTTVEYDVRIRITDLAALRARFVSADPTRGPVFDAREPELTQALSVLGESCGPTGDRCFLQPMRADVLRKRG